MHSSLHTALLLAAGAFALPGCGGQVPGRVEGTLPALLEVEVTGHEFSWEVRYPGPDGRLGTGDDVVGARDVYLPAGWPVRLRLRSEDYIYTLRIPPLGAEEIAVPDMVFEMDLGKIPEGVYPLRGDQMCGFSHPDLIGRVVVSSTAAWRQALSEIQSQ